MSSGYHQFLILELGDFRSELLILRNQFFFPPGVIIDLVVLVLDQPRHFLNSLLELAILGVDIDDYLFVGWVEVQVHSVISVSRFSLVMISELSLDWMSLSVISLFLVVLWSMGSFCSFFLTFQILVFICDRVLIILLQAYCSQGVNYSYAGASGQGCSSAGGFQGGIYQLDIAAVTNYKISFHWRLHREIQTIMDSFHIIQNNAKGNHLILVQLTYFLMEGLKWVPLSFNIIFPNPKFKMQKRNYQQFRDEPETELPNYQPSIPVGQPIAQPPNQNPYVQYPPIHQYAPQPQQYIPEPPIIVQQNQVYPAAPYPQVAQNFNFPVQVQCPACKLHVPTVVNHQSGNTTYLWCSCLFCFVSPLCCCVPFLMDSCLDKTHYCPNCGHNILRKKQRCFEFINC